ncbi:ABC transporter substrate-binding protein [Agromyces sp. SYSU T00194]|uniref:ABC transporter substrate-binding protein n=1 Tax=Agromyces chitinivorans TaxID=3158560 RepID=UPI0033924BCD
MSFPHRARSRRASAVAALAAASALVLAGCSSTSEASDAASDEGFGTISVQLSWIKNVEFAGEYVADDAGYIEEAGFDSVELVAGPSAAESLVASGSATLGLTDPISVAPAIVNEGAPIKIIATTYQKNPFTILSMADAGDIQTPEDLVGKRIGVQAGNETLFDALLAANGISADDVTVVPVEYDPSVLVAGDVDGFLAYITNESIIVESQGYEVTNLPFADNGLPFVTESLIASQETIDEQPEMLGAYLYALIRGWQDAYADPQAAVDLTMDLYGEELGLDPDVQYDQHLQAEELINTDDTAANGLFTMTDELIAENLEVLSSVGTDIAADDLFDFSILEQVYADHPELIG